MDLNSHVKAMIETMTCHIHNQKPSVVLLERNVEIMCCCTDFKIICLKKMAEILTNHKDQSLKVAWKKPSK